MFAQGKKNDPMLLRKSMLPPQLQAAVDSLGTRAVHPGNERVVTTGVFLKAGNRTSMRVTRELPNKIRIDMGTGTPKAVASDGMNAPWETGQLSDDDLDLAESLGEDCAEAVLSGVQNGFAVRPLGERFRTDRGANPDYRGPWLDIFEIVGLTNLHAKAQPVRKHFVFDSDTKYLRYVRYQGSRPGVTTVQTEWSGWVRINGQAVPTRAARRENGVEVWSFSQDQITIGPAQADGAFHN